MCLFNILVLIVFTSTNTILFLSFIGNFAILINFDSLQFEHVCGRSCASSEVKLPLPSNNPLILSCDIVLSQKTNGK